MAAATQHSIQLLHGSSGGGGGGGSINGMPHGLGLLTTVASLPPKYRSRYLMNIKTKCEIPLDLSVKPISPQIASDVPIATTFADVYTEPAVVAGHVNAQGAGVESQPPPPPPQSQSSSPSPTPSSTFSPESCVVYAPSNAAHLEQQRRDEAEFSDDGVTAAVALSAYATDAIASSTSCTNTTCDEIAAKPITPPLTPTKRKFDQVDEDAEDDEGDDETDGSERQQELAAKRAKIEPVAKTRRDATPARPIRTGDSAPRTGKSQPPTTRPSKANKATRKLKFDEETSSPVSGTIIRPLEDITDGAHLYSNGDIDPKYNIVEITEETKAELAAIKNVIGDYICRLCRLKFDDAFGLARHRCACIVLLEYRCPECGKQFNCPANLASHRRWHKPKKEAAKAAAAAAAAGATPSAGAAKKENNRNTTNKATATTTAAEPKGKAPELVYACDECGKRFKRPAYLRKHQATHASKGGGGGGGADAAPAGGGAGRGAQKSVIATSKAAIYSQTYVSASSLASSSASSVHSSYSGATNEDVYASNASHATTLDTGGGGGGGGSSVGGTVLSGYDYDMMDSMSECSNSSSAPGYGRLQIIESVGLTEEENIAAAALTNLRNCASVIQHTTLAH